MKKSLLLLAIATLLSLSSFAQWSIGGSVGVAYNHPFLHHIKYDYYHYTGCFGPTIDFATDYQCNDRWSITGGLSFQQKGYRLYTKSYYSTTRCNDLYLSSRIMVDYSFAKRNNGEFFVDAGAFGAYWCDSYRSYRVFSGFHRYKVVEFFDNYDFKNSIGNRWEFGLIGGLGYKWHLGTKWTCFAVARYEFALTKQYKEFEALDFLSRNNAIVMQFGLLGKLKN
ncbi:MAG: outer membrane beta-barrel protein [Bacteroidales bacterium]|nr:outer membrane beta-barrel protein [Bacteroidales bacterium]